MIFFVIFFVESAVILNHRRNVECLLQHGAPGDRALKHAVWLKFFRVVQIILDRYSELLEIITSTSWSPLTCRKSRGFQNDSVAVEQGVETSVMPRSIGVT